jgi:cyclopropane-fatty-acyl-phospholipid synthase
MSTALTDRAELLADRPAPGLLGLAERGLVPDALLRAGIRQLCTQRLREIHAGGVDAAQERHQQWIAQLRRGPIAIETDAANTQHYEVPTEFFQHCLGPRLKYSSCYFPHADTSLADAELAMLELYAQRAQLSDGQDILELGCGWGSLTLWLADRYPRSRITAVSNSHSQRQWIMQQCERLGLPNVKVITCDVNQLDLAAEHFDRCVSVEMFEHVRNHEELMARIACWLRPGGKLFVHIFAHRDAAYPFETNGEDNWMGRHFFTGGMMPAADTLLHFQRDLAIELRWLVDGTHYERTANLWLARQDDQREAIFPVLARTYGSPALAALWFQRWRMFWMSCAELFGYANGQQWLVAHYRFARPS